MLLPLCFVFTGAEARVTVYSDAQKGLRLSISGGEEQCIGY